MPQLVSGINSLVLSVNLIPVLLYITCLFLLLPPLLTLPTHHSHHPQLPHSFTPGSKLILKSFPNRFSSNLMTDSTDFMTGPFLLSIFGFCFFLKFSSLLFLGSPYVIGQAIFIFIMWFLLSSFFLLFSSPDLSCRILDVYHTSTHGVALVQI